MWSELREWWPRRGRQWDALAVVEVDGHDVGPVLVEAKSYPREQYSRGTAAKPATRAIIAARLAETRQWLRVDDSFEPAWMGRYYQVANRLAALYWWRQIIDAPAWLLNVYFVRDPDAPTTREQWKAALEETGEALDLPILPQHTVDLFLDAGGREELVSTPSSERAARRVSQATERRG